MKMFQNKNGWSFTLRLPKNWFEIGDVLTWVFRGAMVLLMSTAVWFGKQAVKKLDEHWMTRYEYTDNRTNDLALVAANRIADLTLVATNRVSDLKELETWRAGMERENREQYSSISNQFRVQLTWISSIADTTKEMKNNISVIDERQRAMMVSVARIEGALGRPAGQSNFGP
jgi:hypothetical protein